MRITDKMSARNYMKNLNALSSTLNTLNTKVSTGRSFLKSSEDAASAIRAYNIRTQISKNDMYQENISYAQSSLTDSESSLNQINQIAQEASTKILSAKNATKSLTERTIIANELSQLQTELLSTLNSSSSDVYYFGGTNIDTEPFTVVDGKLNYNGAVLDNVAEGSATEKALLSDSRYLDIGLNVAFDSTTGEIDKSTVFSYSITGLSITGYGKTTLSDGSTVSNNLYDLLGSMISELTKTDIEYSNEKVNGMFGVLSKTSLNVINSMTVVGAKSSYLDFMTDRLETQELNLKELQVAVEGADPAATILDFASQKLAYEAALQMGTKLLQPSIFDYMA
ncbi:MAG: flagellar hook-associated protein FlgL [Eubacteriales bacterium]|nr:flagellar hook-associated protein FlgL [Eubacteriales bacterium]